METPDLSPKPLPPRAFPSFINGNFILQVAQAENLGSQPWLLFLFLTLCISFVSKYYQFSLENISTSIFTATYPDQDTSISCLDYYNTLLTFWSSACTLPSPLLPCSLFSIQQPSDPFKADSDHAILYSESSNDIISYQSPSLYCGFQSPEQCLASCTALISSYLSCL